MYELIIGMVGVGCGSVITFFVSWYFYRLSSKDLMRETKELCRLNNLVLKGLEEAGLVTYNRDKNGKISGMVIELAGKIIGQSHLEGKLTDTPEQNNESSGTKPNSLQ